MRENLAHAAKVESELKALFDKVPLLRAGENATRSLAEASVAFGIGYRVNEDGSLGGDFSLLGRVRRAPGTAPVILSS